MHQVQRATEKLKDMKKQYDEDKLVINTAKNDLMSITQLLAKMENLPIISGSQTKDDQLLKLLKEIKNYSVINDGFRSELNGFNYHLEERRREDIAIEKTIENYNSLYTEVEAMTTAREPFRDSLKGMIEGMTSVARGFQLSTLDIDFITDRLEARSQLYEDYQQTSTVTNKTLLQISAELGRHIFDIRALTEEFLSYKNNITNGERVHEILKKIKGKEDMLDDATEHLKKFDTLNSNIQQLFDAVRLHNITHIFELSIKNYHQTYLDLMTSHQQVQRLREELEILDGTIKNKEKQLEELLEQIITQMKKKTFFFSANRTNKDLLDYLKSMYTAKKDSQDLRVLAQNIKQKGNEIVVLCRKIITIQEKENQKLSLEISAKTDLVKNLQERFNNLQSELDAHSHVAFLQNGLDNVIEENEQLAFMNDFLKASNAKMIQDSQMWRQHLEFLETQNFQLIRSNLELKEVNMELKTKLHKMENYAQTVRRNLREMQMEDPDESDDSYSL